jgi:hypothetical protein
VAVVEGHGNADADRGPLEIPELEVRCRRAWGQGRDHDLGQELVAFQTRLEGADEELLERNRALAALLLDPDGRVEELEQRAGVGVRLGEAEVSAERPHCTHADVGHVAFHPRHGRKVLAHERVAFEHAVRRRRADPERAAVEADGRQTGDGLHIHEVIVVDQAFLHGEDQLGAARVDSRRVPVTGEQLRGFRHGCRLGELERSQHALIPCPRVLLAPRRRSGPRCRSLFAR